MRTPTHLQRVPLAWIGERSQVDHPDSFDEGIGRHPARGQHVRKPAHRLQGWPPRERPTASAPPQAPAPQHRESERAPARAIGVPLSPCSGGPVSVAARWDPRVAAARGRSASGCPRDPWGSCNAGWQGTLRAGWKGVRNQGAEHAVHWQRHLTVVRRGVDTVDLGQSARARGGCRAGVGGPPAHSQGGSPVNTTGSVRSGAWGAPAARGHPLSHCPPTSKHRRPRSPG